MSEMTPEQDAATRRAQLEMCLPEHSDAETRAAERYTAREDTGR